MLDKLDFMLRFWDLKARYEAGAPLTHLERGELLSLLSLMVADDPMPEPAAAAPHEDGFPVQIAMGSGFVAAEARYVCSAGLVVVTTSPIAAGQRTVARLADCEGGFEHTLPCVVEWSFVGNETTMALRVDGAPTRMRCVPVEQGAWGVPFGWSDPAWAPIG
jgi:hypothetical protein